MFKYENVPGGSADYSDGREYFVGIAAVLENSSEYREVSSILRLNLLYFPIFLTEFLFMCCTGGNLKACKFC